MVAHLNNPQREEEEEENLTARLCCSEDVLDILGSRAESRKWDESDSEEEYMKSGGPPLYHFLDDKTWLDK